MVLAPDVQALFNDARDLHQSALKVAEEGDLRDAAVKAWCAVNRATTALVLARTDARPGRSPQVTHGLTGLADDDFRLRGLADAYFVYQGLLHGTYFYDGKLDSPPTVTSQIRRVGNLLKKPSDGPRADGIYANRLVASNGWRVRLGA